MRFFRAALLLAISSTVSLAGVATLESNSLSIFNPRSIEVRADISHQIEKRQAAQVAKAVLKTWFKIGKAIFKDYQKAVEGFDADGAGFHRDFADLVEAELPEPPAGFDLNVVPTEWYRGSPNFDTSGLVSVIVLLRVKGLLFSSSMVHNNVKSCIFKTLNIYCGFFTLIVLALAPISNHTLSLIHGFYNSFLWPGACCTAVWNVNQKYQKYAKLQ